MNEPWDPTIHEGDTYEATTRLDTDTLGIPTKKPAPFPVIKECALLCAVLVSVFWFPYFIIHADDDESIVASSQTTVAQTVHEKLPEITPDRDVFNSLSILGKSIIVADISRGEILYAKDPDTERPIASITKLMTALVAHELLETNALVTIPQERLVDEYTPLHRGDIFEMQKLLDYSLMISSNEGATAIAQTAAHAFLGKEATISDFVRAMNIRAESIGLTHTSFKNPSGLDISETEAGALSTARETAMLMSYILKQYPDLLTATTRVSDTYTGSAGFFYDAENTNGIVSTIPGLLASKTGYTDLAGGNLAVAFNAGVDRIVVIVVLGSTRSGRFDDVAALVDASREALIASTTLVGK